MDKYLVNPKKKKKLFKVTNFTPYTYLGVNASTNDGLKPAIGYDVLEWGSSRKAVKGYCVNDTIFFYSTDKWLYQLKGSMFIRKIESKSYQPILSTVTINGENVVIALCGGVGYLIQDTMTPVDVPMANSICEYKGRIFFANENLVYYGDAFDYENFTSVLGGYGYFSFDKRDGDILKIIAYNDCILVFCKRTIYKIYTTSTGDFITKKLNTMAINISDGTIEMVGNQVLFVSNGKLTAYKDGVLRVIDNLENYCIRQGSDAVASFNNYTLSVTNGDGQKAIFVYDVENNEPFLIENDNLVIMGNGYAFDNQLLKVVELGKGKQNIPKFRWQSKKIDFSMVNNKNLTEIRLIVNGNGMLKIKGDFGQREFLLNKEYQAIKPNLYSKYFIFEIESDEIGFGVKNLQLEYSL